MRVGDTGAGDAVSRLLPRLTPVAVLLTDDPDGAVRLLITALTAPRALDSPDDGLRALLRVALHTPRWAAEQLLESRRTSAPADEDEALAGAWRGLDVGDRVAVILQSVVDLPPSEAGNEAPAARLEHVLVGRDDEERRERARTTALYRRPGAAPEPAPPTPDLGDRLRALAAGRPLPETAAETIAAAVSSAVLARRRRRLRVTAAAVGAVLLAGLLPLLPRGPVTPTPASVYAGPTRGSLAGDEDFLRAIRDSGWALATDTSGPLRVVFAGDVPGDRYALVAAGGTPSRPATTAWFAGPANAPPDQMSLLSIRGAPDPAEPVSVIDPATGALVVVGAPGDRVRLSDRPEVGAGGSISRSFRNLPTVHGVVALSLAPIPHATVTAVRLQVERDHRRLDVPPPTVSAEPGTPPVDVLTRWLRPSPSAAADGDGIVAARVRAVLGQLGEPVGDTPVTVLWSGDLPGPNDQPARLTVVAIPRPSGAVVVTTPYGYTADPAGRIGSSWCGTGVLPAGIPLEQRVVAVQCDLSDLSVDREISRFLVVVGPREAASMRLLDATGNVLRERQLADGVAVVRSPGDVAEVDVTTADGGTTSAIPLVDTDLAG
jgi:hypothetical protein